MGIFRQLDIMISDLPEWGQLLIAALLATYCIASIYGRINTKFGAKVFSRVSEAEIKSNKAHIVRYTVIPVIVTAVYLFLLFGE